jgi:hypothetical protein
VAPKTGCIQRLFAENNEACGITPPQSGDFLTRQLLPLSTVMKKMAAGPLKL